MKVHILTGAPDVVVTIPDNLFEQTQTCVVTAVAPKEKAPGWAKDAGWVQITLDCGHVVEKNIAASSVVFTGDIMACAACLRQLVDVARKGA